MPRLDLYHDPLKRALEKDGWVITDDPFLIEYKGLRLFADLGAEKVLAAAKEDRQIVIEVKVFAVRSMITELEKAIGQYQVYKTLLRKTAPERELFLAIATDVYDDFFSKPAIQEIIQDNVIKLLVFNPDTEEVTQWIS